MSISGLARWARLSFRFQRWEVLATLAGVTLLAAAMLWVSVELHRLADGQPGCPDPAAYVPGCEAFAQRFQGLADWGQGLLYLSWGAPFAMGLLLGVPIVSREIESGTAGIAWTLSRSRVRWLLARLAFAAIILVALLVVLVLASGALAAAILPQFHLDRDFTWYGRRDWLVVARGVAALGIGALIGTVVGRVLPAILVAAFASALVFAGLSLAMDRWNETLAVVIDPSAMPDGAADTEGALSVGQRIELPDGSLVAWEDAGLGDVQMIDETGALFTRFDEATGRPDPESLVGWDRQLVVPGRRYPGILLRESAIVIGVGLLFGLGAGIAVTRRRPA